MSRLSTKHLENSVPTGGPSGLEEPAKSSVQIDRGDNPPSKL